MSEELYSVTREFDVPVERLWQVWTDPAELEQWYHGTEHLVLPGSMRSQPYVDGLWTVAIDVPQHSFVAYFFGRYTAVEEQLRLEHTMHYTQSADEFAVRDESTPHHDIVIEFEDLGETSVATFTQFGEMPEEQIELTRAGMESYFDSLEEYLEG